MRAEIIKGAFPSGKRLPTEQEIGEQYDVSRNTVRLALAMLVNEGIITSTPRRGTFVREHVVYTFNAHNVQRPDHATGNLLDTYGDDARSQGREFSESLQVQVVAATPTIATRLVVDPGVSVVLRRIVYHVDGRTWSLQNNYYPMDVAQRCDLLVPKDVKQGTVRLLASRGYEEVGYHDEITGRMPSPDEVQVMDIQSGVPVLVHARIAATTTRVVRLSEMIFPADRNRVVYDLGETSGLPAAPTPANDES